MRTTSFRFLALLLIAILVACAASGYAVASHEYAERAAAYNQAGDKIQNMRGVGRVSDAQWTAFSDAQDEVRAVDMFVLEDLSIWRDTGKKPDGYDGHAQELRNAQDKVIRLAQEVSF